MAEAIAETKENMVLELYRVIKGDLVNRIKVRHVLVLVTIQTAC
jgi:hypothetical protein